MIGCMLEEVHRIANVVAMVVVPHDILGQQTWTLVLGKSHALCGSDFSPSRHLGSSSPTWKAFLTFHARVACIVVGIDKYERPQ